MGNILKVDLTAGTCVSESLDPSMAKDYIGGRGLGIYYINQFVNPDCNALSPDNLLVMTSDPLTGTGAHGSGLR
jgi:aldehyde:ferredoxin oxidoreductase